jgi:hypothetical protein
MRRTLLALLSLGVLCVLSAARAAADDDAKAILTRAIKAHGGEATLLKYQAGKFKNKGKLTLPGLGEIEVTQNVSYMLPNKFKETMEMEIAGTPIKTETIVNGDKMSIEANGKEVPISDAIKKALEDGRYMLKVGRLVDLVKDKGYKLEGVGEIKVEGKPAVGIRVSHKGKKDINLYFNKETSRMVKVEHRGIDPMTEKEFTEERIVTEYMDKKSNGVLMPKKVLVKRDGKTFMEAEVEEGEVLEKIDDSEFKK